MEKISKAKIMISDDISPTERSIQLGEQNQGGRVLQEINQQIYSSQNLKRILVELQDRIRASNEFSSGGLAFLPSA